MSPEPKVTLTAWRASATPLHGLAIFATTFRLYHRCRTHRLWWDDAWAFASLLCELAYCTTPWIRTDATNVHVSLLRRIVLYWLTAVLFPIIVCISHRTARISICMSIARLVPPHTRDRRLTYVLSACFFLVLLALLMQKLYVCCKDTSWHHNRAVQCYLGSAVGILSLGTDIVGDSFLVAIPLHMLWKVKLPRNQKRLIFCIFASSILSSMAGVVYAVFVFNAQLLHSTPWQMAIGLSANIKATVTLLVCNLLVIVTYIYRVFWKQDDETMSETTETRSKHTQSPPPRSPTPHSLLPPLTTVSLSLTQMTDGLGGLRTLSSASRGGSEVLSFMLSHPRSPQDVYQTPAFLMQEAAPDKSCS